MKRPASSQNRRRSDADGTRRASRVGYLTGSSLRGYLVRIIARDDQGDIYSSDQPPHRTSDRQPLIFEDRHIYLSVARAERLCTELNRLLGELSHPNPDEPDTGPRQPYLIMIAALPAARQ